MPSQAEVKDRPVQTCHPAATIDADAAPVSLASADVGGVEIRVQRSRAFTASGMALDSSGAPLERPQISVMRIERNGSSSSSSGLEMRPGGQFIARGLTPGDYAIRAEIGGSRFNPEDTREREIAYVPFRIESSDVEGLLVATSRTIKLTGRVLFEDDPANRSASSMRVMGMPDMSNRMVLMGPQPSAPVKPDLTFELSGLFGPTTIALNGAPRGWVVKTIKYRGQDITDTLVDFAGSRDGDALEIALTNRGARVSGRITDDRGAPASDARVMLLSADPARWKTLNPSGVAGAMPKADGSFQLGPVRAGEYLIIAIGLDDGPRMPMDVEYVERVARNAQRITLVENEQHTIDLRVAKLQ
jgi:protocatechuate 3,4-dioxygenase beta subunit